MAAPRSSLLRTMLALALGATLAGAAPAEPSPPAALAGAKSGIDLGGLDRTCKACDDFYQFANGGWLASHPIPAAYATYGSFDTLHDDNLDALHAILEDASRVNAPLGSAQQKIGDFYASCMDEASIHAAWTTPVAGLLTTSASVQSPASLASAVAELDRAGVPTFFSFGAGPDYADATKTIAQIRQGGLGLPDKDLYLKDDAPSRQIQSDYLHHVQTILRLAAVPGSTAPSPDDDADHALAIETALAGASMDRVTARNPRLVYHRMSLGELQTLAPQFDWATFFAAEGVPDTGAINVAQPGFIEAFGKLVAAQSPEALRAYLSWHVLHAYAPRLPAAFADANFAFFGTELTGAKTQLPRWKRCVTAVDQNLGDALGQAYVARAFPADARARALDMVTTIEATLRADFATLDWMTPATRAKAIEKLDAFQLKIGYPDRWRDYATVKIARTNYAGNVIAARIYASDEDAARIGKPTDRTRWSMTPPTVNAYYSSSNNEIVFPAGILRPPFYDKDADMAVNFGAIGAVIGHESTHGFDDSGRQFDASGNLADWWTPDDSARFDARANCVVKQFDALSPVPGVNENGKLVEGEEIADLGGVTIAYAAFQRWQATHPRLTLDGFTPEQRFFLGWAKVWASNARPEAVTLRAKTDVHAYDKFRVNATLANLPEFAAAWFCALNAPMVRAEADRCRIW